MGVTHVSSEAMPADRSAIDTGVFRAVARFDAPIGPRGWHHHGDQDVVGYLMSGNVRIESGPGGRTITDVSPGDLIHIERGTVHRETYKGQIALVGFAIGPGPGRIDVDRPEASVP